MGVCARIERGVRSIADVDLPVRDAARGDGQSEDPERDPIDCARLHVIPSMMVGRGFIDFSRFARRVKGRHPAGRPDVTASR
jgi:hypothetical protein